MEKHSSLVKEIRQSTFRTDTDLIKIKHGRKQSKSTSI
jgi:hypothetical protein